MCVWMQAHMQLSKISKQIYEDLETCSNRLGLFGQRRNRDSKNRDINSTLANPSYVEPTNQNRCLNIHDVFTFYKYNDVFTCIIYINVRT